MSAERREQIAFSEDGVSVQLNGIYTAEQIFHICQLFNSKREEKKNLERARNHDLSDIVHAKKESGMRLVDIEKELGLYRGRASSLLSTRRMREISRHDRELEIDRINERRAWISDTCERLIPNHLIKWIGDNTASLSPRDGSAILEIDIRRRDESIVLEIENWSKWRHDLKSFSEVKSSIVNWERDLAGGRK